MKLQRPKTHWLEVPRFQDTPMCSGQRKWTASTSHRGVSRISVIEVLERSTNARSLQLSPARGPNRLMFDGSLRHLSPDEPKHPCGTSRSTCDTVGEFSSIGACGSVMLERLRHPSKKYGASLVAGMKVLAPPLAPIATSSSSPFLESLHHTDAQQDRLKTDS